MAINIRTTPESVSATGPGPVALPDVQVTQRTSPQVAFNALLGQGNPYYGTSYRTSVLGDRIRPTQGLDLYGPRWSASSSVPVPWGYGGGGGGFSGYASPAMGSGWHPDRQHVVNAAQNVRFMAPDTSPASFEHVNPQKLAADLAWQALNDYRRQNLAATSQNPDGSIRRAGYFGRGG